MIDIKAIETATLILAAAISGLLGTKEVKNWIKNREMNRVGTQNPPFCPSHDTIFNGINNNLQSIDRRLGNIESTLMKHQT